MMAPANPPHEPRREIMRTPQHFIEIGIHAEPAQERDLREGLAQEAAQARATTSHFTAATDRILPIIGAGQYEQISLHGLEYQYRGLLITDSLRCDIKPLQLGY